MWMFRPTWAQEPMVTWLSTMVPSPTYAPTFTYAGGITMLPGARYAPRRMLEPPGTMRTPSAAVNFRTGKVSLSKKENCPSDMSVTAPNLKPARITSFTHLFTFHSPFTFSATRSSPFSRASSTLLNSARVISIRTGL